MEYHVLKRRSRPSWLLVLVKTVLINIGVQMRELVLADLAGGDRTAGTKSDAIR
jgi:hypothetical protein